LNHWKEAIWKKGSPYEVDSEKGLSGMPLSREVKRSEITQQFRFYTLPGILPEGHVLVLNTRPYSLSTFVLTQLSGEVHRLVAQEVLTELEMYVLIALLDSYPHYCPYEVLRAAITDEVVSHARVTVHEAVEHRTLNRSMKPIRNILSRCRAKLQAFGIDIRSIHGEGYFLTALRSPS
jgi:DNA-binding winged helix-turn-helix (wHTH) protein